MQRAAVVMLIFGWACADLTAPGPAASVIGIVPGAVGQGSFGFAPNPLVIDASAGARVIWANGDYTADPYGGIAGTPHQIVSDDGLFDSGMLDPTRAFTYTFPGPGTYNYHCLNHPTMIGVITILP